MMRWVLAKVWKIKRNVSSQRLKMYRHDHVAGELNEYKPGFTVGGSVSVYSHAGYIS